MKEIWFVTSSEDKYRELVEITQQFSGKVKPEFKHHIVETSEIQTEDMDKLIHHKAMEAFKKIKRPLLVEHTSLHLKDWGQLPGGLTQIIWSKLTPEQFMKLVEDDRKIVAKTYIGYIDGKKIHTFVEKSKENWQKRRAEITASAGIKCLFRKVIKKPLLRCHLRIRIELQCAEKR